MQYQTINRPFQKLRFVTDRGILLMESGGLMLFSHSSICLTLQPRYLFQLECAKSTALAPVYTYYRDPMNTYSL